jgi:pimeloyl-ACP methyl ester carboxylesterase
VEPWHGLLHDYGGRGPVIHVAHANGFPPGAYRLLAEALAGAHHPVALPARPLWPGSRPGAVSNWRPLAADLVAGLDALELGPVVGVGHSLGGVLTLWAAIDRPDLFRAVVLVDPVLLAPHWLWALRITRWLGLHERQPLVQGALRRRRTWPDHQACFDHYRDKALFARWPDAALWDYVESGTQPGVEGVTLRYPPEWEARIFATTPTGIWRDVPRLQVPALIVRGAGSDTFSPGAMARVGRALPTARLVEVPGAGHLVPMEKPAETAAAIRAFLADRPASSAR